jgi:hypothetical protein
VVTIIRQLTYATSALHGTVVPSHGAAHSHAAAARGLWVEGSPGARGLKRYQPEQQIGSRYLSYEPRAGESWLRKDKRRGAAGLALEGAE